MELVGDLCSSYTSEDYAHASIEMTQRYAHLAPDYLGKELARLDFAAPTEAKVLPLHGRAG
jgi:hypothetical protein